MKLSIPVNFDKTLIERLDTPGIGEVYGKLREDVIGGGRLSVSLPRVSRRSLKEYVYLARKKGIGFNYLLNAPCLGNLEWTRKGQLKIRRFLDWLALIGVESVTVTAPYLLHLVKKLYPFKACVSVIAGVDNPLSAKYWQELGADQITLSQGSVNRDFESLKKIRSSVSCRLQLIANLLCLYRYPFCAYHYSLTGHYSQREGRAKFSVNYCLLSCQYQRMLKPYRFISAGWIRPEDAGVYEALGIDSLKLVDRRAKTETILRIAKAYARRSYPGNLFDLFVCDSASMLSENSRALKKDFMLSLSQKLKRKLYSFASGGDNELHVKMLDNRSLDGFLRFFIDGKCNKFDCDACGYCQSVAQKSLTIPDSERQEVLRVNPDILEAAAEGKLFDVKSG